MSRYLGLPGFENTHNVQDNRYERHRNFLRCNKCIHRRNGCLGSEQCCGAFQPTTVDFYTQQKRY